MYKRHDIINKESFKGNQMGKICPYGRSQRLKPIKFKLPIIAEDMNIILDNDAQVESVVLLEKAAEQTL